MWYDLAIYSLKVGACLAVFYLFFKLLLSRETFHRFNRIVVLGAIVLSFVLPLCVITVYRTLPALPVSALPAVPATADLPAEGHAFPWERLFGGLFAVGVAGAFVRLCWSLGGVVRLIGRCDRRERLDDGTVLVHAGDSVRPFSWGRYIVLSDRDRAVCGEAILLHERAHVRMHHSADLLLTDLCGCLQWFNPAMWLLRRELRDIHEYEADEAVISSGIDAKSYQLLLIRKAVGGRWYSIANSFNHSKLKNRITMMLRKNRLGGPEPACFCSCRSRRWLSGPLPKPSISFRKTKVRKKIRKSMHRPPMAPIRWSWSMAGSSLHPRSTTSLPSGFSRSRY